MDVPIWYIGGLGWRPRPQGLHRIFRIFRIFLRILLCIMAKQPFIMYNLNQPRVLLHSLPVRLVQLVAILPANALGKIGAFVTDSIR